MKKNLAMIVILFLSISLFSPSIGFEGKPLIQSTSLVIYFDGVVSVEYVYETDPDDAAVNVSLIGQIFEDVTVINEEGLPLDFLVRDYGITIFTLGANQTTVTYNTQDLTKKEGRYWTIEANTTSNTTIYFPIGASIISISKIPLIIQSSDDQILIVLSAGFFQITYVVGVVGTREHAQVMIADAETTINEIKELGLIVTTAENKLQEAIEYFNNEDYVQAEILAQLAKEIALQINEIASDVLVMKGEALAAITKAESEDRTQDLKKARDLLDLSSDAFDNGDYELAYELAVEAKSEAEKAVKPFPFKTLVVGLAALIGSTLIIMRVSKKHSNTESSEQYRNIDTKKILENHDLRDEEIEAIQILAAKNGQSFEADLYDHLNMPRTTTWRMVRRLQEMGIIKIKKFRRQNLVIIERIYDVS